jgi:hypothetical protein
MIASENPPGFVPRTGAHDQGLGAMKDFVPWAADPISDRSVAAVETIERAVTVDLIATFEPQLRCCAKTDSIVSFLADSNYAPYDYLPVRSDDRCPAGPPDKGIDRGRSEPEHARGDDA